MKDLHVYSVHVFLNQIVLPLKIWIIDRGTETGIMGTIQSYLREKQNDLQIPIDSVLYGPSTQNKIERWWQELLKRMEKFFKSQLASIIEDYDAHNETDR